MATSTCILRGRRGTCGTGLALVACFTHHLSHTICHTQLCHTESFTHSCVTHRLCLKPLCHTHTQLCHTPSFTHNSVTHTHTHHLSHTHTTVSHTMFHTQLCHTQLCHTQLCHTQLLTYNRLTDRSSTTSFVYLSFPVPLEHFVSAYWKKLTCGVIRSFNFLMNKITCSLNACPKRCLGHFLLFLL